MTNTHTQHERQHYLSFIGAVDFRPKNRLGFTVRHFTLNKSNIDRSGTDFMFKGGVWECFTEILNDTGEYDEFIFFELDEKEYPNIFIYAVQFLMHKYQVLGKDFDDIAFIKDLWTELLKIKTQNI